MAYGGNITTSKHGRRLGLQRMSTGQSGGSAPFEFLVGPDDFRVGTNTAESTGSNLEPFGISGGLGTSAGSSAVYTLDPPIPGVRKVIASSTANGPVYVKTSNAVVVSSAGSTDAVVKLSTLGSPVELIGLSSGVWLCRDTTAAGHDFLAST